ncbi:hypothetical protein [Streptococcus dentiloxodontae]
MNQYLVAIHYIELIEAEFDIFLKDSRLLFDLKVEPSIVKEELKELKAAALQLSDKNRYIEGTIWYQPTLFDIIDKNLGVIDDWLGEIDVFLAISYKTEIVQALRNQEKGSYHLLVGLYDYFETILTDIKAYRLAR